MRNILGFLAAALLLASCSQYEKAPSGMVYKIKHGSSKEKLKHGQFVKFNISFAIPEKDTVLNSSFGKVPAYFMIDTARLTKHNFTEILTLCAVGDVVDFKLSNDTLKNMGAIEYNDMFPKGGMITGKVEFIKVFPTEADMMADYQKEILAQRDREMDALTKVLDKKGDKYIKDTAGVLVVVKNAGDTAKAVAGKTASVFYKGYLADGKDAGKEFDSNMNKEKNPGQKPFDVNVGTGTVIRGWDLALKYFGKGGKGTIYVPSMNAYGPQGSPPVIPAYSNLAFDVEITDVKQGPPPAAPAIPMMPRN
jgi:FKBP-type peptidyl-prolyl cis-trans isomerase